MAIGVFYSLYRFIFFQSEIYHRMSLYWVPQKNIILIIYFLFTYLLIFYSIFLLSKRFFYLKDYIQKKRIVYIGLGLFCWVFFSLDILSVTFQGIKVFFIGNLAGILFILFTTYALTKLDLFDMRLAISGSSFRLLNSILEKMVYIYEKKQVFNVLKTEIQNILDFKVVQSYIYQKDHTTYYYLEETNRIKIGANSPLVKLLENKKKVLFEKDIIKHQEEIKLLNFKKNDLLLPIYSSDNLEGFIILTIDDKRKFFDKNDLRLFDFLIKQIIPILDRTTPYEKIREDFEATKEKLHQAELHLERIERIASVGRITQQFHHELRTPLSIIQMSTENLPDEESLINHKKKVLRQINRALTVINSTMDLYKGKEKKKELININALIEEANNLLPPNGYMVKTEFAEVKPILGFSSDLLSVITNLIDNAKKAMQKTQNGLLTIKTWQEDRNVIIEVSDNGKGIEKKDLVKIWEPYFTTNPEEGHGLGLSIVNSIVEYHQGTIKVESKPNKGTKFTIEFPCE